MLKISIYLKKCYAHFEYWIIPSSEYNILQKCPVETEWCLALCKQNADNISKTCENSCKTFKYAVIKKRYIVRESF